jgi:hypothetical protein
MIGLNSYPCNKGMILSLSKDERDESKMNNLLTLGIAFSHPLMCNVAPFNAHEHEGNETDA